MLLVDKSCRDFSEALAGKEPVPGGGGASALVGALGASLGLMAANFTVEKKKYAEHRDALETYIKDMENSRIRLLELVDKDAEVFAPLAEAYRIPKDEAGRAEKLEKATDNATLVPLGILEELGRVMEILGALSKICSPMLISDVGCAAALARAGLFAGSMNVYINTRSLLDREKAMKYERQADEILGRYLPMGEELAATISNNIRGGA